MARLSKEQWQAARLQWEGDPREGFDWIANELGGVVSRQAISKTAKKEGWNKVAQLNKSCATKAKVAQPPVKKTAASDKDGYFSGRPGPGRTPGAPNKLTRSMKQYAAQFGDEIIDKLVAIVRDAEAPLNSVVAASRELLDRGFGKPKQEVEVTGEINYVDKNDLNARYNKNLEKTAELALQTQERIEALKQGALH